MKSKNIKLKHIAIAALHIMLLSALSENISAQIAQLPANPKLQGMLKGESTRDWLDFREGTKLNPTTMFTQMKDAFELKADDEMKISRTRKDNLGFTHYRFQQYYKNLKVLYGEYAVHQLKDSTVRSANGRMINGLNLGSVPGIKERSALASALGFVNASKYLWQNPVMEAELKRQDNDLNSTYYPKGELVYAPGNDDAKFLASDYRLAWQFKIYTDDPKVTAKVVYVDAITGQVIRHADIAMNCSTGSGTSAFNGTVSINTQLSGGTYRSLNDCQSTHIYVYNCSGGAPSNTFYTDDDNSWTTQQSAVQAQFGAAQTYSYYNGQHNRQSWNNASGDMIAYNNAFAGSNNACWGCYGNNAIFYAGNTGAATDDWNTDDIMGHEFTHGVTQSEAGLDYNKESGALNESFSDIFGEMVESWAEGNCDYLEGADRGAIRSFINPNIYGQPDTYLGTYWYSSSGCTPSNANDQCGVHTNSGVQNHWFYLLAEGGTGTTDFGQAFNVTGITRFKARLIAYRALTEYLNSSSQYIDARAATLHAAYDIYGGCSAELIAVGNAWHAVGVEAQSPYYAYNVCGTYSTGGFTQPISQLTASAGGCITTVTSPTDIRYFTARDRVILYPGFKAVAGSRFIAYLEPCSATVWRTPNSDEAGGVIKSDPEKGIFTNVSSPVALAPETNSKYLTPSVNAVTVSPNPFHAGFEVAISSKENAKGLVYLYNSIGVKVQEIAGVNIAKGSNTISLNGAKLANGVYMVEVHMGTETIVKKVVKF